MPQFIPVNHDPFSAQPQGVSLVPVDYDPFKNEGPKESSFLGGLPRAIGTNIANIGAGVLAAPAELGKPLVDVLTHGAGTVLKGFGADPQTVNEIIAQTTSVQPTEAIAQGIDQLTGGYTVPRSPTERSFRSAGQFIGNVASPFGAVETIAARSAPAMLGPLGENVAGAINKITTKALKSPLFANKEAVENIALAQELGIQPTAQMVGGPTVRGLQDLLASNPLSVAPIKATQEKVLTQLNAVKSRVANQLGSATTRAEAGSEAVEGLVAKNQKFKDMASKMYQRVDQFMPADQPIPVGQALKSIDDKIASYGDLNQAGRALGQDVFRLRETIANGQATPAFIRAERRNLMDKAFNPNVDSAIRNAARELVDVFSKDLESAAAQAGPQALSAFKKADRFYAQGKKTFEPFVDYLDKNPNVEKLYNQFDNAILGGKSGSVKVVNDLKKAVPKDAFDEMVSYKLRQLGTEVDRATQQEIFSPLKFFNEWNRISPEAKKLMFAGKGQSYLNDLNKLSSLSKVVGTPAATKNPPRTAGNVIAGVQLLGAGALGATNPFVAALALAGPNIGARLLESPQFVRWLSRSAVAKSPQQVENALKGLTKVTRTVPYLADDISAYVTGENQ